MITEEQRKNRKNHLGGSDLPVIMGFGRKATAYDIWLHKTGRIPEDPTAESPDYLEGGNDYEPGVIKWAQRKGYVGDVDTNPEDLELSVPETPIVLHTDAIEIDTGNPIEVKLEGIWGPMFNVWGDAETTEVSEYTCIQAHGAMMALDQEICHVLTHLGYRGRAYFYVQRDEALVKLIKQESLHFWNDYVLTDTPPPDSVPSLSLIRKIRRVAGGPVELSDKMVQTWLESKDAAKVAVAAKECAHAQLLATLDGHQEGTCTQGLITNYEQSREAHEVKASRFRVMRLKKAKVK